jgi:hypothetical protein
MQTRHITFLALLLFFCQFTFGQKKFKVEVKETGRWRDIYCLVDEQGKVIRQLDTSKYYVSFNNDQYGYFAIFGKKGSTGWTAIDANENELFKVYNTSFGEPSPDYLVENKIRIIDGNKKIGFANYKGEIIIKPRFEIATSFHNGKAIIAETCQKVLWDEHAKEAACHHYSIVCKKHGYINEEGVVVKIGDYSFDQISKETGWKMPDD